MDCNTLVRMWDILICGPLLYCLNNRNRLLISHSIIVINDNERLLKIIVINDNERLLKINAALE